MTTKRWLFAGLIIAAVACIVVFGPRLRTSAQEQARGVVPDSAIQALREGRYLRASQIMRAYLEASADSSPQAILFAAQAEAGIGDWQRVEELLGRRNWLDSIGSGEGWDLLGQSQLQLGMFDESGRSFARYLEVAQTSGNRDQGVAQIRRATAFVNTQKYDSAVAAYDVAARMLPQIQDWIEIFSASAAASAGDTAGVRVRLDSVDATLVRDWGWRSRVRARQNAKDYTGALSAAQSAAAVLPSAGSRAEAWLRTGELRLLTNDAAGARTAWRRAMSTSPGSNAAIEAARNLSESDNMTIADQLLVGRVYLRHGNATRGIAGLVAYLDNAQVSLEQRNAVRLELGNAHFNAGRYAAAAATLRLYADSATDQERAAAALYTAVRATYRGAGADSARILGRTLLERFPHTEGAASAAFLHADLDHDRGAIAEATQMYRRAIEIAPASDEGGLSRMRLAGIAYASSDYAGAAAEYNAYLKQFPDGQRAQQALYWNAQALRELGQQDSARALLQRTRSRDPLSYYGNLAREQLDQSFWSIRMAESPAPNATIEAQVSNALARVDLLREIDWNEAADTEMQRARAHFGSINSALYSFAEALNARGFTSAGITLGWDIRRREGVWNTRLLRIIYPFPYQNIIVAEAKERGVDPYLAAGLIRQESMFNPNAVSGAGAVGLMQVMPATGKILARTLKVRRFTASMLKSPEVNIHIGMAYLADQLRTWDQRPARVLAAYNAGPTRVDRWSQFPEWGNDELFTERIPFTETRDYVKIVQHNAQMYEALYSKPISSTDAPATAGGSVR